jgi:hypothetical protein
MSLSEPGIEKVGASQEIHTSTVSDKNNPDFVIHEVTGSSRSPFIAVIKDKKRDGKMSAWSLQSKIDETMRTSHFLNGQIVLKCPRSASSFSLLLLMSQSTPYYSWLEK